MAYQDCQEVKNAQENLLISLCFICLKCISDLGMMCNPGFFPPEFFNVPFYVVFYKYWKLHPPQLHLFCVIFRMNIWIKINETIKSKTKYFIAGQLNAILLVLIGCPDLDWNMVHSYYLKNRNSNNKNLVCM